jgi:hypothetical protein
MAFDADVLTSVDIETSNRGPSFEAAVMWATTPILLVLFSLFSAADSVQILHFEQ